MYATQGADQTARMHMLVWAFVVRTCMLHKALIRLCGCTCLSGLLFYVHVCYISTDQTARMRMLAWDFV